LNPGAFLFFLLTYPFSSYTWFERKALQEATAKQDLMLKRQEALAEAAIHQGASFNDLSARLRNIELVECASPAVAGNPQLAQALNCPTAQRQQQAPASPLVPAGQGALVQPVFAAPSQPAFHAHMPNYGWFGTGAAGISKGAEVGYPAFSQEGPAVPVPFR
jgi:hypothetical protein